MPILSNKPVKPKYTVGDTVYALDTAGSILQLTIVQVQVVVTNPNNDSNGLQANYYTFSESTLKLNESQLASSKNHLLSKIKGDSFNEAPYDAVGGVHFDAPGQADLAGQNFDGLDLTDLAVTASSIMDGVSFDSATLPTSIDTKAKLRSLVKSYDETTTIWTDGNPIGRA